MFRTSALCSLTDRWVDGDYDEEDKDGDESNDDNNDNDDDSDIIVMSRANRILMLTEYQNITWL